MADRGARAKYITSLCSGSLILRAAGLLKGYKATSHWPVRHVLSGFGAIPTDARVVRDRNRITGAGVTAGLDFGLSLFWQVMQRNSPGQPKAELAKVIDIRFGSFSALQEQFTKAALSVFGSGWVPAELG